MTNMINFSVGVLFSTLIFQGLALETDNFKLENDTEALNRGLFGLIKPSACVAAVNKLNIPSAANPTLASASPLTRLANGRVYFFSPTVVTSQVTWAEAKSYCATHGMHLVTLETERENRLVFEQASVLGLTNVGGTGAWIGLRDTGVNDWRWILRNTHPTYTAFNALPAAASPCVIYIDGAATAVNSWLAEACAGPFPFICEMEPPCSAIVSAVNA